MNPDKDYISEPEFQDFFSLTPDLLCISDVDGNFIKINSAWHETLGYSEEELLSYKIYSFIHPDDLQSTTFAMKDLTDGKEIFNFVNRYRNKEGNYKYIEWRARPKGRYIYSAARDITERIISEKYIQESQTILDMFFSQSLTGFFFMMLDEPVFWNDTVDKEKTMDYVFAHHRITKINQAMLDQYGAKKEEFVGLSPNDLFSHDLVHGRKTWMDFFDQGRLHVETREKKLDGTPIYILGDYLCLYDEQGRITGHFGVQTDITNLKQAQEDLITAKQLAEEASEAKSRFLANMSHEIRTPLNGVIGFTDLLGNTDLTPIQLQYVENANISGHTLLGIISDILDFSKIEAGMMELDLVRSDLIEIVENSIDLIKFQAGKKNIEILLNIDNQLPQYALLDAIRLKQVLANLLSNAIKFTLAGEVELKIKYIPMSPGRGQLKFSVRDTGIGINENDKIKIFKAFTQIDSQPTREFGGTGLGLVISDMIVRKMGSTIKIDSKVGEGSTFYFDIETEVYSEKTQLDLRNSEIKNCLLVDDSKANIDILRDKFQFWGIPTDFCYDGNSALNMLKKKAYDLIICDYHMPNMNGIDLIRKIRYDLKLTSEKQAILLLHSSSDDIEIYNDCLELDVSYRLTKPVKFGKLHDVLLQCQSGSD
ncbi:MAG: PAS domain S-box protein [Leptospira sp.]|nr:PAS domain S-box protein [Leptospira sp.]